MDMMEEQVGKLLKNIFCILNFLILKIFLGANRTMHVLCINHWIFAHKHCNLKRNNIRF